MIGRRTATALIATTLIASALTAPTLALAGVKPAPSTFYNAVGPTLAWWRVDTVAATVTREGSVELPALVQYAWRHPKRPVLYVASSNFVPMGKADGKHHLTAFHIDRASGALTPFGSPVPIKARPIHITVDGSGGYLLAAYNIPSSMSVHALAPDGTIGSEAKQLADVDGGIYAHQIRMFPSNKALILVTRGNNAVAGKPEDPGALKVKRLKDGQLTDVASVAIGNGLGFGPRHVDFHPTKPWLFASVERQNQLQVWRLAGESLQAQPVHTVSTLAEPANLRPEQMVGPIHVHPNGRFVYLGNRASGQVDVDGKKAAAGGENTIVMFRIDPVSGKPDMVQAIGTNGFHPRTFSIDPSGRMLVVANLLALPVRNGDTIRSQPATLSSYRIAADGKLEHVQTHDIETNGLTQWWSGFMLMTA